MTAAGIEAVAAGCPGLQHLHLLYTNVTDVSAALFPNANVIRF